MSVTFAREPLTDALWDEALPLLHAHWKEIARFPDIELAPDRALYASSEAAGILRCFTARQWPMFQLNADLVPVKVDDGVLVGYALYFVRPAPHYRHSVQAVQDVLYLSPSVRGGTGYKFIRWCDEQLAAEGAQCVYQHVKTAHDFGKILERQGYEQVERIFVKRLDLPTRPVPLHAQLIPEYAMMPWADGKTREVL